MKAVDLVIIWVAEKFEMIIWVCGTVGLWDSCGRLNDPRWRVGLLFWENEMIIWVCGTVGLGE